MPWGGCPATSGIFKDVCIEKSHSTYKPFGCWWCIAKKLHGLPLHALQFLDRRTEDAGRRLTFSSGLPAATGYKMFLLKFSESKENPNFTFFLFLTDGQQNNLDRDDRRLTRWTARCGSANLFKMDKINFWASHFPKQSKCWDCPLWKGNALTQRKKFRKKHFSPWIFKYSFLQNKERERRRAWVPA